MSNTPNNPGSRLARNWRPVAFFLLAVVAVATLSACSSDDVVGVVEETEATQVQPQPNNSEAEVAELEAEVARLQAELDEANAESGDADAEWWQGEEAELRFDAARRDELYDSAKYHLNERVSWVYEEWSEARAVSIQPAASDDNPPWPNQAVDRLSIIDEQIAAIDGYRLQLDLKDRFDYDSLVTPLVQSATRQLARTYWLMEAIVDRDLIDIEDIEEINHHLTRAVEELKPALPPAAE